MTESPTPPHHAELTLTDVGQDQLEAFERMVTRGFHSDFHGDEWEAERKSYEPGRWFGFRSGDRWVTSALSFARTLFVPGGTVAIAAVTAVTVSPAFRRRGLLTQMMRHQLTTIREPIAMLYATESVIYGRFGYGGLTRQLRLSGRTQELGFLPEVDLGHGSVDEVSQEQYRTAVVPLRETILPQRPGHLNRNEIVWDSQFSDPEYWRNGAGVRRFALHFAADGSPDGYATFRTKRDSAIADGREVQIEELDATNPQAYAGLWRWLLDLDLIRAFVRHNAPIDEPLHQLAANPRMIKTELTDAAYARIVDVPAALGARTYRAELDVVIEVVDQFLPEAGGRFRLISTPDGAEVKRTDATPDLSLSARLLGSIYLGGTTAQQLSLAGLITEHTPGTVDRLTAGFATERAAYCPDFF